jgi:hypothetical protein
MEWADMNRLLATVTLDQVLTSQNVRGVRKSFAGEGGRGLQGGCSRSSGTMGHAFTDPYVILKRLGLRTNGQCFPEIDQRPARGAPPSRASSP